MMNMLVKDALLARRSLEYEILTLLKQFQEDTGLIPTNVAVEVVPVTKMGDTSPSSCVLAGVRVTVAL